MCVSNSEKLALQLLQNPSINRVVVVVVVGQNQSRDFSLSDNDCHNHALIWLTFKLFNERLENG